MPRFIFAPAILSALLALAPGLALPQASLFEALAGPGENVQLVANAGTNGDRGTMRTVTNSDGTFARFEASGRVVLRSPKINLDADSLVYDAASGSMIAEGAVDMDQPGVEADCRKLDYNTATGEVRLMGRPNVVQTAEDGSVTKFSGMEDFVVLQKDDGTSEIRLLNGQEILCEMASAEPETGAEAPGQTGFAAFGRDVKILVRPRQEKRPQVLISTQEAGGIGLFRAEGSVLLESDTMNLRSDQLEFNGPANVIEALYNVYIKQDNIESDCGRMFYDLTKDRITLSVNPFVREQRPDGVVNISEMDSFVIIRNPDGTTSTEAIGGVGGAPKFEYQSREDVRPAATPARPAVRELDTRNPDSLKAID